MVGGEQEGKQEESWNMVQVIKRLLPSALVIHQGKLTASVRVLYHNWFWMACHIIFTEKYLLNCITLRQHRVQMKDLQGGQEMSSFLKLFNMLVTETVVSILDSAVDNTNQGEAWNNEG